MRTGNTGTVYNQELDLKNIALKLSSLKLTTGTIVILLLLFIAGIVLVRSQAYSPEFKIMNHLIIRDWFLGDHQGALLIRYWFIGICLFMVIMGINLVFCSWNKFLKIIRVKFHVSKLLMLFVHALFGLVALCHFGGYMLGYKYQNIRLEQGEVFRFEEAYELRIDRINFTDDPAILVENRKGFIGEFDYQNNYAEISISKNGKEVLKGEIYYLKPVSFNSTQITLRSFYNPTRSKNKIQRDSIPGVNIAVNKNPALPVFLIVYPVMIVGILIYLVMTWRESSHVSAHT